MDNTFYKEFEKRFRGSREAVRRTFDSIFQAEAGTGCRKAFTTASTNETLVAKAELF